MDKKLHIATVVASFDLNATGIPKKLVFCEAELIFVSMSVTHSVAVAMSTCPDKLLNSECFAGQTIEATHHFTSGA